MFSPIWGKGNGRGISGFAVNRGAVNRGFTVYSKHMIAIACKQFRLLSTFIFLDSYQTEIEITWMVIIQLKEIKF